MRDELKAWIDQAKGIINNLVYEVAEFHDCGDDDANQIVRCEIVRCERDLDKHFAALATLDARQPQEVEYIRNGVCLLCGGAVLNSGEHIDPDRHVEEVTRITTAAPPSQQAGDSFQERVAP